MAILAERFLFRRNEKEARSRASPPAAGRFCDKILYRRMAILAERFLFRRNEKSESSAGIKLAALLCSAPRFLPTKVSLLRYEPELPFNSQDNSY